MAIKLYSLFSDWESIRQEMIDGVSDLKKDQLNYIPPGGLNSIAGLLRHIAETENWWVGDVILGIPYKDITREDAPGIRQILACLEKSHEQVVHVLKAATTDTWDKVYKIPQGHSFTLRWIVWHLFEHECRHRGQIFMLMRLQDIEPPNV